MTTMVLVPGMWLGAWAWQDVASGLAAAGHDVRPVTLTGLAERAAEASAGTDLDTHVADVVTLLEKEDLRDVVLVGHSYGGMVVSTAAGQVADRVRRVVYVESGPLPERCRSSTPTRGGAGAYPRQVGDSYLAVPPFEQDGSPTLAGLDEEALARIRAQATPHPFASVTQPVHYTPDYARLAQTLITCMFAAAQAREMIATGHPFFALLRGADVEELPTGHWPMFSRPADLAELLARM
jgi:pimeloyl-ACP methyl ester carboxylesterase